MTTPKIAEVAANNNGAVPMVNVDLTKPLPNLTDAQTVPFDLMAGYWTPEKEGEKKRVFFDRLDMRTVQDLQDPEKLIDLECAFFIEQVNGDLVSVSNGAKRLVSAIQAAGVKRGTPLEITYLGKRKNSNNNFYSDMWSVKPLIFNQ